MNLDIEKLKYLLNTTEREIGRLIDNVLSDSQEDPHYSAVYASNQIKCYIQIMNELGEKLPYIISVFSIKISRAFPATRRGFFLFVVAIGANFRYFFHNFSKTRHKTSCENLRCVL